MKTISIIVAAYNMEDYLGRCLNSVVDHKWDDSVEVIVVNDGSQDNTLQIARRYQSDYPQIVTVIDKENGHHGSCTNVALPVAKGKYVKVLDADDWFDPKAFDYLIHKLKSLDSDLIITNYSTRYASGKTLHRRYSSSDRFDFRETLTSGSSVFPQSLSMHAVTYRTELLQKMNYRQSEGVYYSDNEWIFYPLFFVETWAFVNADVYQHFLGREGQSMDPAAFKRNTTQLQVVGLHMLEYYSTFNRESLSKARDADLFRKVYNFIIPIYRRHLLWQSDNDFAPHTLAAFDKAIRETNETFYNHLAEEVPRRWMPIRYIKYWRTHARRLALWVRFFFKVLRKIADINRAFNKRRLIV
ncbi:MAG: glycosyltransferase family 2 protein [Tannerellaceae bacterium]|jgi:glycosyltransferase involved in cell wall biosynthesis|nr:glycosyltransferase family 2 protein [Tannerellaceae bacterium]